VQDQEIQMLSQHLDRQGQTSLWEAYEPSSQNDLIDQSQAHTSVSRGTRLEWGLASFRDKRRCDKCQLYGRTNMDGRLDHFLAKGP
jgi:hypothetical protein